MVRTIGVLLAALGLVACAHQESGPSESYLEQSKSAFATAYDAVKTGAQQTATAGKYALQAVGSGTVRVWDRTKELASSGTNTVEDGWITGKIKSEYAVDPVVKAGHINVDTDNGVVTLRGQVQDEAVAERAINTALATKGVLAVESKLQTPQEERPNNKVYVEPVE